MRKWVIAAAGVAAFGVGIVLAQEQTASDVEAAQNPRRGEDVQQALRDKAKRIPARNLASALRAASDGRDARAVTLSGRPDLGALREDLKRTEAEDAQRSAASGEQPPSTRTIAAARREPPPQPGIRPMAAANLKSAAASEISRVRIPVLIPADPAIRDRAKVYGMENVYTAAAAIDAQASLTITGTCNRVVGGDPDVAAFRKRLADGPKRLSRAGAAYQISRNDFGVDLSFAKFGCGYVMTIECGDPAADARCAADDYITGLADSMILANPELAGGE
jgi:hypothetical protein